MSALGIFGDCCDSNQFDRDLVEQCVQCRVKEVAVHGENFSNNIQNMC